MSRNKVIIVGVVLITFLGAFISLKPNPNHAYAEDAEIQWITMGELEELNKNEPRKVFVDVYTDWCGWCKKMDRSTFIDPEVVNYVNENYYAVKLNAESRTTLTFKGYQVTEADIARSLKVSSFPTIVFIDETIQNIQPVPGYRTAKQFKEMLVNFNK